jgi:SAM-dependent methyltransferase
VSFEVPADAYARFMGAYSEQLAVEFADFADVRSGHHALDVGCGPGALTAELVSRVGADLVVAIDPSASFVEAARRRLPEVEVRVGAAENLPYPDGSFDAALAQLVVQFMRDPVVGLREMGRVTKPGGLVAACVWDHAGGRGPLSAFWDAAREIDPGVDDESQRAGAREGHLLELMTHAGLDVVESTRLTVRRPYAGVDDWWEPFTYGIGPVGTYMSGLDAAHRAALRDRAAAHLPTGPFEIEASAWAAKARP